MDITPDEFSRFQRFLKESSGILLSDNKQYLVKNRLTGLLQSLNMTSFGDLLQRLESSAGMQIRQRVVDAMTTNETFWFRDPSHFDVLIKQILPEIADKRMGSTKIWSAACSSGQEPYSISLLVAQALRQAKLKKDVDILGTDISHDMLDAAKLGIYSDIELARGLKPEFKTSSFQSVRDGWQLKEDIRRKVRFRHFNLLDGFQSLGKFDVIFCRNVLIYFSDTLKTDILNRMAGALNPGGCLFLSSTEALPAAVTGFEKVSLHGARYFKKA